MFACLAGGPVPVGGAQICRFVTFERFVAGDNKTDAGRHHQAFLAGGNGHINAPVIHAIIHRAERGDGVHHEESPVTHIVNGPPQGGDIIHHAGGGIDLHHQNRFYLALGIRPETGFEQGRINRLMIGAGQHFDIEAKHIPGIPPANGEGAAFQHENLVSPAQDIRKRRFPGAMAIGDIYKGRARGSGDHFQIFLQPVCDVDQFTFADIHCGAMHGGQHCVRDGGGTRNAQKLAAVADTHGVTFLI